MEFPKESVNEIRTGRNVPTVARDKQISGMESL